MSRYRILRLITWLPVGGIERKIAAVLPRLDKELFEVHLCCLRERGPLAAQLEEQGIPVHLVKFRARWDPLALRRLFGLVRSLGIDLIHSHMYRANTPATAIKLLDKRIRVAGHYHNVDTWESARQQRSDGFLARRRDMNVCVSDAVRSDVASRLRVPPERLCTLYNGVDLDEFRPASGDERLRVRQDLGIGADEVVVTMVARLVRQKNQELLIRSVPEVLAAQPRARFLLVGGGPDEDRLVALAGAQPGGDRVHFLGSRDDVPALVAASDVSVLPSLKEGFSNTILESMASGIPVLANRVGGNPEIIERGVNGYLCDITPSSSPNTAGGVSQVQFVRHLKRLVCDHGQRAALGRGARASAMRFSIDSMVEGATRLYRSMLEEGQ